MKKREGASPRARCNECQRPLSVCLCSDIVVGSAPLPILVLQDPREAKHPLSTTPLLIASIKNARVIVGDVFSINDITKIMSQLSDGSISDDIELDDVGLVYPSEGIQKEHDNSDDIKCLILLDGTWKHVKKILLNNPWLKDLRRVALYPDLPSEYRIRHTQVPHSVSTFEAALLASKKVDSTFNPDPHLKVLRKMVDIQIQNGHLSKNRH